MARGRGAQPEAGAALLAAADRKVAALARRLVALVTGMIDGVEVVAEGKRLRLRRRGDFAWIEPREDHVRLGFDHGAALPNLGGLLEGRGARARHVVVRSTRQVTDLGLKTLLSAALFDDDTHGFRRRARPAPGRRPRK